MANPLIEYIESHKQDAVIYKAKFLISAAGDDFYKKSLAVDDINHMLSGIKSEVALEYYAKEIAGYTGIKSATLLKSIKEVKDQVREKTEQHVPEGRKALPAWVNKERLNNIGFDWIENHKRPDLTGMWFPTAGGNMEQMSNFVMKPIVHILSHNDDENRRITEINNGIGKHVFELPSKAFLNPEQFQSILMNKGVYMFYGLQKHHLLKITSYYLHHYPRGYELKNLGWQAEGFFAFSNLIYHNGIIPFDEYGLAEIDGTKYLSMGSSNILSDLRKGTDVYKNDKYLRYDQSPITFGEWCRLMLQVYESKAMMGIAWCLLAANRDIVAERTSYCPIPYCYGAAQSGKSQFMGSLCAIFFKGLKPFNLNQGTEPSFWDYAGRFSNVLMPFNEFDENGIDPKRVKAFKSMADLEGRNRMLSRNKSETQEPTALPGLLGQYLATMDDGAVLGRSMPEKFVENNNRPPEQIAAFNKLKDIEKKGISSLLCGILEHRDTVAKTYSEVYSEVSRALKEDFSRDNLTPKNRVLENYTVVLALVKIYADKLDFGFTYEDFYQYCKAQVLKLNNLIGESNSLGEFWKAIEHLADIGWIEPGWDYKVETNTEVKSLIGDKGSKKVASFDKPTRLLFLRLNNVYPVFAKEKRQVSGKAAINFETMKTYLQEQPYYIGAQSNGNFISRKQSIKKGTSSMVLNYDMLNAMDVNLERFETIDDPRELVSLEGHIKEDAKLKNILDVEKVVFTLLQDESYINGQGMTVEKLVYTKCFYMNKEMLWALKLGAKVRLIGMLSITKKPDSEWRNMEVQELEVLESVPGAAPPSAPRFMATPPKQMSLEDQMRNSMAGDEIDPGF